ncbi:MAG: efflux RND transporter periplasmic adaptor subunit [Ignavibacteria bacterium]
MKKTNALKILLAVLLPLILILNGCDDEKVETRNMDQIYKEEGVPVKVKTVSKNGFSTNYTYNTILTGIRESSASAMIGGRIEKINVKVGDYVEKDQVIVTFPTDNPSTQYFQTKAAYENAQKTYERYNTIYEQGGISKQTLDDIKTQLDVSKANFDNMKEMVKVKAPISGYVTKINVNETDNVAKETVLVTISDLSKLKTKLKVNEDEISDVSVGTKVVAKWQGISIEGTVTQVDMAMNPATQAFNADVVFNNKDKKFKSGITVEVTLLGSSKENVISIERKNIVKKDDTNYAFVAEGNTAKMREVEIGKSRGLLVEVLSGLNEGDLLITEGQMFLEDATKIKIVK